MADFSVATPGSPADSVTPAKQSAAKDRPCPYCNANFTSSSLGRHLDVYIKEKNPKPPDGIHDVEQIRRSRGNITRRQARTSSGRRDGSTPLSAKPSLSYEQQSPKISQQYTNGGSSQRTHGGISAPQMGFKTAGWEATGVINDIPPASRGGRFEPARRELPRKTPVKVDISQRRKLIEERERSRAMELALKEVLDSVKAANARAHPTPLFEYDFLGQSFPALCLRCLARPSTIASSQLIPTSTSWPIDLPGAAQAAIIRQRLDMRLRCWKKAHKTTNQTVGTNGNSSPRSIDVQLEDSDDVERTFHEHLSNAYSAWTKLSEAQQRQAWHLEGLRAFAQEQQDHGDTHVKLVRLEQECANMRLQLQRLNECQQPREYLLYPPNQLPVSRETASLLVERAGTEQLEFDALVNKWKSRVQSYQATQKPLQPDRPMGAGSEQLNGSGSTRDNGRGHMIELEDDDSMDAPGDADEGLEAQNSVPSAPMDRGMLDPKLRDQGDEVMQGIEGEGGDYIGGKLLAGLREHGVYDGRC